MKNLFLCLLAAILLMPQFLSAQLWEKAFDKDVNFIKMTEAGVAIVGTDDALYGVDNQGNTLWQYDKLKKLEPNRIEVLAGSELIFASDKGLLARNRVINVLTGVEYAPAAYKGDNILGASVIHPANILLVVKGNKHLDAWDISSNQKLWSITEGLPFGIALEKAASLTATFVGMQPITYTSRTTGIMHLGSGHLAEYDFETGKANWYFDFKPYKFKKPGDGKGDGPSNPSKNYAVMKYDASSHTLYFPFRDMLIAIDTQTGQPRWQPKANKVGQVRDLHILPEGLLVLNLNGLQLIDPATGATQWDKPLKVKGAESGLLVQDDKLFYMVSKKYVLEIDVAAKKAKQLTDKIKFEGGESFSAIEMQDNLILLSSSQNIMGINKRSGEIAYQHYFKAPGASLKTIAQNVALAAIAAAASYNSQQLGQQSADAFGRYNYYSYTPAMMDGGTRNSATSANYKYINTKFKKGFGLARINKTTGELEGEIMIGDRSPVYAQDENAGVIFYRSDKKKIACEKLD
jgi:hypothetical protein